MKQKYGRKVWNKAGLERLVPSTKPFAELFNEPLPMSEITDEQKDHLEREDEITRGMRAVSGKEDKLQKVCVEWLEQYLEKNELDTRFEHIANQPGGYQGANAKAMGHGSGMPDLLIFKSKKKIRIHPELFGQERREETIIACGLFIELKTPKGRLKREQITTHESLRKQGYQVEVVRDYETFKQTVIDYLKDE